LLSEYQGNFYFLIFFFKGMLPLAGVAGAAPLAAVGGSELGTPVLMYK
jgi:hypothetical protein